ncbi:MAG: replicative DNA helicase [Desulfobulbaceae bacterium]|nr:replicative DNA helicase [Desulfobulbaceae bacterium]
MSQHRIPPQNIDAERAVLAAMLLSPAAMDEVADRLRPEDFYSHEHAAIYAAALDLYRSDKQVDLVTVTDRLSISDKLDVAGGPAYLAELTDQIPSMAALPHHAELVRDKARLRAAIVSLTEAHERCYAASDPADIIDEIETTLLAIGSSATPDTMAPASVLAKRSVDALEQRSRHAGALLGLSTGFRELDQMTSGLQPADLIIIAARPSMGKTSLAMNIARHAAVTVNTPTAVFSMEMSKEQLVDRMICDLGELNTFAYRNGQLLDQHWPRVLPAAGKLAQAPLFIDDQAGLTAMAIRARARRIKAKHGLGLIVVDYLQLMDGRGERREAEISAITRALKALAKELRLPVVVLAQLNRELERRPDKRPKLSDLRESGAIEQDADVILFIYRDEVYNRAKDNPRIGIAEIIIGKQRTGPTGTIELAWMEHLSSFRDMRG